MIKTYGLRHIALAVKVAERSFRFYHDVFGAFGVDLLNKHFINKSRTLAYKAYLRSVNLSSSASGQ